MAKYEVSRKSELRLKKLEWGRGGLIRRGYWTAKSGKRENSTEVPLKGILANNKDKT